MENGKEMIYLRVGKTTKTAIETLKEISGMDSNQVFYSVLKENGIGLDQDVIDRIFLNVDVSKLKQEIAKQKLKQLQDELMEKLNLNADDIAKIMH